MALGAALRRAALLLAAALPGGAGAAAQGVTVTWRELSHPVDALPPELPEAARSAILAWSGWAGAHGYRLSLDREGRVLLVTSGENERWRRQMRLVEDTCLFFDRTLPLPPKPAAPATTTPGPAGGAPDVLPEDPEAGPAPWEEGGRPQAPASSAPAVTTWGTESLQPDVQTIVFLVVRTESDYATVIDLLVREHPYLEEWSGKARALTGFALQVPLAGATIELAEGMEEWDPDNEVVHRIAQLLLLRRYGQQPHWLVRGWSWHAELELLKAIFCFPDRAEFVWATEHTGWAKTLRERFRERAGTPLAMKEFADWPRGTFDAERSRVAWGVVRFLLQQKPGALPELLVRQRDVRDRENRVDLGEGKWERRLDYEVGLETQARLLVEVAGPSVFADLVAFFLGDKG